MMPSSERPSTRRVLRFRVCVTFLRIFWLGQRLAPRNSSRRNVNASVRESITQVRPPFPLYFQDRDRLPVANGSGMRVCLRRSVLLSFVASPRLSSDAPLPRLRFSFGVAGGGREIGNRKTSLGNGKRQSALLARRKPAPVVAAVAAERAITHQELRVRAAKRFSVALTGRTRVGRTQPCCARAIFPPRLSGS